MKPEDMLENTLRVYAYMHDLNTPPNDMFFMCECGNVLVVVNGSEYEDQNGYYNATCECVSCEAHVEIICKNKPNLLTYDEMLQIRENVHLDHTWEEYQNERIRDTE